MESKKETKPENDSQKKTNEFVNKKSLEEDLFMKVKPTVLLKGPLRYIVPYPYVYKSFVKQRWENRTVLDVFSKEFRADPFEYYKKAIALGKIRVNGKEITEDYKLKSNDMIEHETIRKEPPVYNFPIEKIFEDDTLLIINKPPSIPVHVCGHHSFNTIMGILRTDFNYKDIYFLHRLDKLTSGILLISKIPELASTFHEDIKEKRVEKTYLARVHGKLLTQGEENQEIHIKKPIYCVSQRDAQHDVCTEEEKTAKNGKDAETIIKSIWYDPKTDTSLMECRPITGKTHQIRVHLKSIGHPIVNDTSYGGKFLGNLLLKYLDQKKNNEDKDNEDQEAQEKIVKKIKLDENGKDKKIDVKEKEQQKSENLNLKDKKEPEEETKEEPKVKDNEEKNKKEEDGSPEFREKDLNSHVMEIWLHSYKYKFRGVLYSTKMPYWAANKNIEF